jgi:branched-chain amino acid aminotransferase
MSTKFEIVKKDIITSDEQLASIFENPGFGVYFTDHMAHIRYTADPTLDDHLLTTSANGSWSDFEVIPFANISISPAASVFHYGQEIFEGLKAYKYADGSIWLFRPERNAVRFNQSATRLGLPDLPVEDFIEAIKQVVTQDKRWVPSKKGQSLYIRPFMIASEPFLGVRSAHQVDFYCILSPAGDYFGTPKPVKIWVETEFHRAGPGGTGAAKCGGNYAASLLPAAKAYEKGYSQVLFLDAADKESVEELGGMSFFAVYKDGSVVTPQLNGQILESVTRASVIEVLNDRNIKVVERKISLTELVDGIKSGDIVEAFACGTAAVITSISELSNDDFTATLSDGDVEGELTVSLREEIVGIQTGKVADKYGWCTQIV